MHKAIRLVNAENRAVYGGKAANLALLLSAGLPVPQGYAVGTDAFNDSGKLNPEATRSLKAALEPGRRYAVRSSGVAEDAAEASWAGQFETFLNVPAQDVVDKVSACHLSAKHRAHAYAAQQQLSAEFATAVIVQDMIEPEYSAVLFTRDPVSGTDQYVIEYVGGLGEALVSGRTTPKSIRIDPSKPPANNTPIMLTSLIDFAQRIEALLGCPQDIEWAQEGGRIWITQARPITAIQDQQTGQHYLGNPEALFYWGPSSAEPLYMGDFLAAMQQFLKITHLDPAYPKPPKTLILFHDSRMVWLNNADAFADFTRAAFIYYEKTSRFDADYSAWRRVAEMQPNSADTGAHLVTAWLHTFYAEFALYGAELVITERLKQIDPRDRSRALGAFTTPPSGTFLNHIDVELAESGDSNELARRYPWIRDGYAGVRDDAESYFKQRLVQIQPVDARQKSESSQDQISKELRLAPADVSTLRLAGKLAQFMDERKAWMMRTRRFISTPLSSITHGWLYDNGHEQLLDEAKTDELWQRYVIFKDSTTTVSGIVASNGGHHFVNGEIAIATSPTDTIPDGKILVIPSTSPSYVPLMRGAKALITDHGGMMSHAAIVAREFGLPCVVGTKTATTSLRNGDKVVVDLVKGEVIR